MMQNRQGLQQLGGAGGGDPLAALLGGGQGGQVNPMDALNSIQPQPPGMGDAMPGSGGDIGSLMAMLGGSGGMGGGMAAGCPAPSGGGMLDPMIFGVQQGAKQGDPFGSDPYYAQPPLVDRLEGMGLGSAQGQMPQQGSQMQGGLPPGMNLSAMFGGQNGRQ